jgi:hypothetical protein
MPSAKRGLMISRLRLPSTEALGLAVDTRFIPVLRRDQIHQLPDWSARLKANGIACAVGICRCMWSRPVPTPCVWPRAHARA